MATTFIQVTGLTTGQFKTFKLNGTYTHLILTPTKSFASGIPTKNTNYSYFGFESGKYPIVLDPADPFNGAQTYKEFFFNNTTSGCYWHGAQGDGLYYFSE